MDSYVNAYVDTYGDGLIALYLPAPVVDALRAALAL